MRRKSKLTEKMQQDFWSDSNFTGSSVAAFPDTRKDALRRLAEFSQKVSRYSRERNYVVPGHTNVSRLSPAVRHRLITETEVAEAVLKRYSFSTVEKFLQEIYWRRYWKSWLAMRPQVWTEYLAEIEELKKGTDMAQAQLISQGEGPIFVMNDFARELIETGYLHNHARMWFAAYWIHTMRLPWQLGADFFYRHLLDADPASNTLSWRWVAGLQTLGKTYLARRSNIEKYLHRDLLSGREEGLDLLVDPTVFQPVGAVSLPAQSLLYESEQADLCNDSTTGLWVHEEDLSLTKIDEKFEIANVLITGDEQTWNERSYSPLKKQWLEKALRDSEKRCQEQFPNIVTLEKTKSLTDTVCQWAKQKQLTRIVVYQPEVGSLNDQFPALKRSLSGIGVSLVCLNHREDTMIQEHGKAGFFSFWKKVRSLLSE